MYTFAVTCGDERAPSGGGGGSTNGTGLHNSVKLVTL